MNEIKEKIMQFAKELIATRDTENVGWLVKEADKACDVLVRELNSHYIAKEKVLGLKMRNAAPATFYTKQDMFLPDQHITTNNTLETDGYNQAVSGINKAVDSLVEDNK